VSRLDRAWSWMTATRARTLAVAGATAIGAVAIGVASSIAVGGVRETVDTAGAPSASATPADPSASSTAMPSPSASPILTPTVTPTPTSVATALPTTLPTPDPTASPTLAPSPTPTAGAGGVHWPIGMAAMTIAEDLAVRSEPGTGEDSSRYTPVLPERTRLRLVEGPVLASGYWWYRVADISIALDGGVRDGWVASGDRQGRPWIGPSPEGCADLPFASSGISISTFTELEAGIVGTWGGCVTTPWIAPYPVIVTFRADGTYRARTLAEGDIVEPAFYYGTDEDSPQKRYAVNDLQDNLKGVGQIDIVFWEDNTNRGELRNIALMDDQLEFEFFHRGQYGPLTFRLFSIGDVDAWSP
jgi:hypothetical protein